VPFLSFCFLIFKVWSFLNFSNSDSRFLIFSKKELIYFPFINIINYKWLHYKLTFCLSWVFYQLCLLFHKISKPFIYFSSKCSQLWRNLLRLLHSCTYKNFDVSLIEKKWPVVFLNFENFTSHFLKNPKIPLVFLIGQFLVRTDWV
jgi:hypothetical protein